MKFKTFVKNMMPVLGALVAFDVGKRVVQRFNVK